MEVEHINAEIIVILVPLLIGLMDIIKFLVKKVFNQSILNKEESIAMKEIHESQMTMPAKLEVAERKIMARLERSTLAKEEVAWLKDLYDMHNVKTEDGIPIWYVAGSLKEEIRSIKSILEVHISDEKGVYFLIDTMIRIQEKCLDRVDAIDKKLSKISGKKEE